LKNYELLNFGVIVAPPAYNISLKLKLNTLPLILYSSPFLPASAENFEVSFDLSLLVQIEFLLLNLRITERNFLFETL